MIELIVGYAFVSFVVFTVTRDRNASLLWPAAAFKVLFNIITGAADAYKKKETD